MRLGIAADHAGFVLKKHLAACLRGAGLDVVDFGATDWTPGDDYPDFALPLALAVSREEVRRGVAICGSGVGVCIVANKVPHVRAGLCHDYFSARRGVMDDDMNVLCMGSRVVGSGLAWELTKVFLAARYEGAERHQRRLAKVVALEKEQREETPL